MIVNSTLEVSPSACARCWRDRHGGRFEGVSGGLRGLPWRHTRHHRWRITPSGLYRWPDAAMWTLLPAVPPPEARHVRRIAPRKWRILLPGAGDHCELLCWSCRKNLLNWLPKNTYKHNQYSKILILDVWESGQIHVWICSIYHTRMVLILVDI